MSYFMSQHAECRVVGIRQIPVWIGRQIAKISEEANILKPLGAPVFFGIGKYCFPFSRWIADSFHIVLDVNGEGLRSRNRRQFKIAEQRYKVIIVLHVAIDSSEKRWNIQTLVVFKILYESRGRMQMRSTSTEIDISHL